MGASTGTDCRFLSTETAAEINTTLQPAKHATLPSKLPGVWFGLVFPFPADLGVYFALKSQQGERQKRNYYKIPSFGCLKNCAVFCILA